MDIRETFVFTILLVALTLMGASCAQVYPAFNQPILSNEVLTVSPQSATTLDIQLVPFCANEIMQVRVTYAGQPVHGVVVALYSHSGGRQMVSRVYTDPNGWAVFAPKTAGDYDIISTFNESQLTDRSYDNDWFDFDSIDSTAGQIRFVIPPCLSPPSGAKLNESPAAASAGAPIYTQNYPQGVTREFYPIHLPDGRAATRVKLTVPRSAGEAGLILGEPLPLAAVPSIGLIGYEWDYPQNASNQTPMELEWNLEGTTAARQDERTYVVLRELTPELAGTWSAPVLMRGKSAQTAQAAGAEKNPAGDKTTAAPAQSALRLDLGGLVGAGILVPILVIGAGTYLYRRVKAAREHGK